MAVSETGINEATDELDALRAFEQKFEQEIMNDDPTYRDRRIAQDFWNAARAYEVRRQQRRVNGSLRNGH